MAFIEGESLDKRIEGGPLKIPKALGNGCFALTVAVH